MLRAARLSGLALAALLAWLAPPDVRACQCAQARPELAPSLAGAAAVVRARVRSHAFVTGEGFHTELVVEEVFKGTPGRVLALDAAKTCAFGFEPGGRYLVFAYADGDAGFTTTYCTRTAPLGDATADVAWLRKHASARVVPRPLAAGVFTLFTDALAIQALRTAAWLWPEVFAALLEPA